MQQIKKDFDRIAALSEHEQDCGGTYDRFLLRFVPNRCGRALEVGCGTGAFTRLLAPKVNHVTAIDLSDEMVRLARQRSESYSNIDYAVGDILQADLASGGFDFIVMIA